MMLGTLQFRAVWPLKATSQLGMLSRLALATRSRSPLARSSLRPYSSASKQELPKLSFGIRLKRAASFTFYTGLVLGGVGLTGIVIYYFVKDILLPTSDARVFNRAFSIVKKDQKSINILGGGRLKAYGEQTDNKWARSRPIASRRGYDGLGREHLLMQFHVQGDLAEGLVRLEMVESEEKTKTGIGKYDFRYLVLEVPGQARHYIIDNSEKPRKQSRNTGFLGVRWGKPKDAGDEDH